MDIVGRIKLFLNEKNITVSQFADGCGIPRPTVSQLLNGRNKKVSDEIISKIHNSYPTLSISWLLFGEGVMLTDSEYSESAPAQSRENSLFGDESGYDKEYSNVRNFDEISSNDSEIPAPVIKSTMKGEFAAPTKNVVIEKVEVDKPARSVVKIIVYYSDNSFEEFVQK